MQTMIHWLAATLAVVSLSCTTARDLSRMETHRTARELPLNLSQTDYDSPSSGNFTNNNTDLADLNSQLPPTQEVDTDSSTAFKLKSIGGPDGIAEMANCEPELRTVELDLPEEANTVFYPTCVRLKQCGGCCMSPYTTCQPVEYETVTIKVRKTVDGQSSSSSYVRRQERRRRQEKVTPTHEVNVTRHTKCKCQCKVQEQDCKADIHTYDGNTCACVCKNRDDKKMCQQQIPTRYWDNDSCTCRCTRTITCSNGEVFSQDSCKCKKLTVLGDS